ncbi:MAG: hypothetical protein HQM00_01925, partial [Magnetococcales bacterium]|nr:hypothetical protein [Magnetococcales bacterium]
MTAWNDGMDPRLVGWLTRFQQDPKRVWDNFVRGSEPVPGYERADIAETLYRVFEGLPEEYVAALDRTVTDWVDPFLDWSDEERRDFGLVRYVNWLVQVANGAGQLRLPEFSRHLYDRLMTYRGTLPQLQQPLPYLDPLLAFYQTLAASPDYAPKLKTLWRQLCEQSDDGLPGYYLHIALQGLRQCPPPTPGAAPPCLSGLAAWLPNARNRREFDRKFRALRVVYPRTPETWRQWLNPFLQGKIIENYNDDRVKWWNVD